MRIEATKFIVKRLPYERRVTKDASDHGHWDLSGLILREQATDYDCRDLRQFPARMGHNLFGQSLGTGRNCWK